MRAPGPLVALTTATAMLLGGRASTGRAQQPTEPSVAITTRSTQGSLAKADPGKTVTAVLVVENRSHDALTLSPRVAVPLDWSVVTGTQVFPLAAGKSDTWVISLAVPSRAAAGRHVIPLELTAASDDRSLVRDSLTVDVDERRAIEVMPMDHPAWVMAGKAYIASFLVHNAGNGLSSIHLIARDARGTRVQLDTSSLMLSPDSSTLVHATVSTSADAAEATEDVLEIAATGAADTASLTSTSVRMTIVPAPGPSDQFTTVPAQLALRAAGPGTGVAPFELVGGGRLNDKSPAQIDFVVRGPTEQQSAFGDRDEYRFGIRAPNYRARVGDAFYGYSQLTQAGQEGSGAGGEASLGVLTAGAYAERFRYVPGGGSDAGASIAFRPGGLSSSSQLGVQAVDRVGGVLPGKVMSSSLAMNPVAGAHVDAEYAVSQSSSGAGSAAEVLVSGNNFLQYDLSHIAGTLAFAGPAQASLHDYANLATPSWHDLQLNFSGSSHASNASGAQYRLRTMNVGVSSVGGTSLSYFVGSKQQNLATVADSVIGSGTFGLPPSIPSPANLDPSLAGVSQAADDGLQRGIAGRIQQNFGVNQAWAQSELGTTRLATTGAVKSYQDFEIGNTMSVGANTIGLFTQVYRGVSVTRGPTPQTVLGGNANIQLSRSTTLFLVGSGSLGHVGSSGYTQVDARLTHNLNTGASISLRTRILANSLIPKASQRLVFLEYSLPLKLPVGAAQTPGRVRGRIVNGETGKGVAGALVQLGGQTAITDADGRVWFAGLAPGHYRVSLSRDMTFAGAAVDGDPSVLVDGTSGKPATFQLAVARAASVQGTVHHWVVARTSIGGEPDSLVDAGPMRGVVVLLTSGRDTLYRTTNDLGQFRFTELAPKHWALKVVTPPAARSRYEPEEMQLDLEPGVSADASFRLVPVHREVHMLDHTDAPVPIDAPAPTTTPTQAPPSLNRQTAANVPSALATSRPVASALPRHLDVPSLSRRVHLNRLVSHAAILTKRDSRQLQRDGHVVRLARVPMVVSAAYKPDDTLVAARAFKPDDTLVAAYRPDDTVVQRSAPFRSIHWRASTH